MSKFILSTLPLALAIAWPLTFSQVVCATEVKLPYQPRFSVDGYLTFFLTAVPLSQMEASRDGEFIRVSGPLEINLGRLSEKMRAPVQQALERALMGEITISGAILDARRAQITFQNLSSTSIEDQAGRPFEPEVQPLGEKMTAEDIRKLEPRLYESNEWNFAGCARLLGRDDER